MKPFYQRILIPIRNIAAIEARIIFPAPGIIRRICRWGAIFRVRSLTLGPNTIWPRMEIGVPQYHTDDGLMLDIRDLSRMQLDIPADYRECLGISTIDSPHYRFPTGQKPYAGGPPVHATHEEFRAIILFDAAYPFPE